MTKEVHGPLTFGFGESRRLRDFAHNNTYIHTINHHQTSDSDSDSDIVACRSSPTTIMATTVDQKILKATKFPPEFNQKVDMQKVNLEVMKKFVPQSPIPNLQSIAILRPETDRDFTDGLQARFQIFLVTRMMSL